jgi:hypothetical protein
MIQRVWIDAYGAWTVLVGNGVLFVAATTSRAGPASGAWVPSGG